MTALSKKAPQPDSGTVSKELLSSLRKMISPLTKGGSETDDIIQEVLIKVLQKGESIEPSKFLAWIHQVSRTTAIDYYRKQRSHVALNDDHLTTLSTKSDDDNDTAEN